MRKEIQISLVWLFLMPIGFLGGCPTSSEWDQQQKEINQLIQRGNFKEAQIRLEVMLPSVRERGPGDPRYGAIIYQLAEIARLQGDTAQAEAYYWKALPLIAQSLGPEDIKMADPLMALAQSYDKKGQPHIALPLVKRALAIREKILGTSSPHLRPTLQQYHGLLVKNDQLEQAEVIQTRLEQLLRRGLP